jgi:hypothetical protein
LTYVAHAYAVVGETTKAMEALGELESLSDRRFVPPEYIAVVHLGLGNTDLALQWLSKAYDERSMHAWLLPDPRLDPLRSDSRFRDLMKRMGLR